jgi:6-methylsalicylate decarboxylase
MPDLIATSMEGYRHIGNCCAGLKLKDGPAPTARRQFFSKLSALGLSATGLDALAQGIPVSPGTSIAASDTPPYRIDMHHHFSPPQWIAEVKNRDLLQRANAQWTPARSIEDMDQAGVATALLSITNPGLWFGDRQVTRRLVRECNDYGASLVQRYPKRFGLFAALPLPDVDACLREIDYAYDTLKADGMHLFTSYGDAWLGDASFTPVMEALNQRKAVVHVHPTAANCCKNLVPDVPPGIMEYGTDTTRAMLGVMFSGTATRFPDIRYIWSHAGGTAPFLVGRIERGVQSLKGRETRLPQGAVHELKKFYYDLAGASNAGAVSSLLQLVSPERILFGTDFPPAGPSVEVVRSLAALGFSPKNLRDIERNNALKLLPRLG